MRIHSAQINTRYLPGGFPVNIFLGFPGVKGGAINEEDKKTTVLTGQRASPLHILFADDDRDDRELFAEVIQALDFNVQLEMVKDGNDLLNRLLTPGNKLPDLVLLDLNMPNKNGRECLDAIRETEHVKKLRVIIYSTSSSQKDINETYEKGANLYISKPGSFTGMIAMAKKLFTLDWEDYLPHSPRRNFVLSFQDF